MLLLPTNGVGCRSQTLLMVCQMRPSSFQQHCSSSTGMYGLPTRPCAHRQLDPPTRYCRVVSEVALVVCAPVLPGSNHGQHSRALHSFGLHQGVRGGVSAERASAWHPSASMRMDNSGPCMGLVLVDNKCATDLKRVPWLCSRPACFVPPSLLAVCLLQGATSWWGAGGRSHALGHTLSRYVVGSVVAAIPSCWCTAQLRPDAQLARGHTTTVAVIRQPG